MRKYYLLYFEETNDYENKKTPTKSDTQYIPRVFNMIKSAMFRVTNKNEGKLLAALNVVGDSIKCLDGPTLHNMLGVRTYSKQLFRLKFDKFIR